MPGVGVLLYSAYIWQLTGYPFTWATGHAGVLDAIIDETLLPAVQ